MRDVTPSRKKQILEKFKARDLDSSQKYKKFLDLAKTDYAYYANRQWEDQDVRTLKEEKRPFTTFNQVRKVVDVIVGSEISNRYDIKYLARTPSPDRDTVSSLMSETVRYLREKSRAGHHETKAFWDCVVCGLGCVEIYQDYEKDPDGLTIVKRVSPFDVRPDPYARETNLRDKQYVIRRSWIAGADFKYLWPDKYAEIKHSGNRGIEPTSSSGIQRIAGYAAKDAAFYDRAKNEFLVNDYQWYERKKWWRIQNPITGELLEVFDENDFNNTIAEIREQASVEGFPLMENFEESYTTELPRREYYRAYICGDHVLSVSKIKTGDFTYHFITGFEDHKEDCTEGFGMIRPLIEPQKWANVFFSQIVYIMAMNPKTGYFYEEGAFADESEARRMINTPGAMIKLLPGGQGKLLQRQGASYPSGMDVMIEHAINAIPNISGVNLFMQGLQQGGEPGVVVQSYQKQGMVILSGLFESLNQYRTDIGDAHLSFIREYMPEGQIIRITDDKGDPRIVQYSKTISAHHYDIVVSQSPTSPNQQQEFWDMMVKTNLLGQIMELGYPVPSSIFNYMPLPDQFKKDWVGEIEAQKAQEAAMMQQQQMMGGATPPQPQV